MSTSQTSWKVGPHSRVIFHPHDEEDPPRVFMADVSTSVTLMPPSDRDRYPEFARFLEELAEAAHDLALECQPRSAWASELARRSS
jgi:hypothetical protein